jgi:hypothetical protein
LISGFHIKEEY